MDTKRCPKCATVKHVTEFGRDKRTKDGLNGYCKDCRKSAYNAYREAHPEKVAATMAKYEAANPGRSNDYYADNRIKVLEKSAERYDLRPEVKRSEHLLKTYGLTQEGFKILLDVQEGQCEICGTILEPGMRTHIDDAHTTG